MALTPFEHDPARPSPDALVEAGIRAFEARQARMATISAAVAPGVVQVGATVAPAVAGVAAGNVLLGLVASVGFLVASLVGGCVIRTERASADRTLADELHALGVRLDTQRGSPETSRNHRRRPPA